MVLFTLNIFGRDDANKGVQAHNECGRVLSAAAEFHWSVLVAFSDVLRLMPHFSQEELVRRFAHVETLQFTYYLRQGRPCFAFCTFIISVIQSGQKTISSKK